MPIGPNRCELVRIDPWRSESIELSKLANRSTHLLSMAAQLCATSSNIASPLRRTTANFITLVSSSGETQTCCGDAVEESEELVMLGMNGGDRGFNVPYGMNGGARRFNVPYGMDGGDRGFHVLSGKRSRILLVSASMRSRILLVADSTVCSPWASEEDAISSL